jgi:hypothetical protein
MALAAATPRHEAEFIFPVNEAQHGSSIVQRPTATYRLLVHGSGSASPTT